MSEVMSGINSKRAAPRSELFLGGKRRPDFCDAGSVTIIGTRKGLREITIDQQTTIID